MTTATAPKKAPKAKRPAKAPAKRGARSARKTAKKPAISPAHKAAVDALCGFCADMDYSVDDYLREKHAGVDAENAMAEQIRREKRIRREKESPR